MLRGLFLQRGATVVGLSDERVAPVLLRAFALAGMVVPTKWDQDLPHFAPRYDFNKVIPTTQNWGVTWRDEPPAGLERVNSHRAGAALIRLPLASGGEADE